MRIIGGKYKRRLLKTIPGTEITRPTSDQVKEGLFNILLNSLCIERDFTKFNILDLFAGCGSLGIESISRGARKAYFIESNKSAISCILNNLNDLKISNEKYELYQLKTTDFLLIKNNLLKEKIDIIFADPPYASNWYNSSLQEIEKSGICNSECLVILEMSSHNEIIHEKVSSQWNLLDTRIYGKTKIEIWRFQSEKDVN